jgi:hypothetical protein
MAKPDQQPAQQIPFIDSKTLAFGLIAGNAPIRILKHP